GGVLAAAPRGGLTARPPDARAAPAGEPTSIAPLAAAPTHVVARAAGDGFLVAWSIPAGGGHVLAAAALDATGRPRGAAATIAQVAERVAFVDLLVGPAGSYVVHEIAGGESGAAASRVTLTPVSPATGAATAQGVVIADGVAGWNAAATSRGAAVARVVAAPSAGAG